MKRHFMFLGLAALVFAASVVVGAENDPRIGTWKLNASKSMSSNGQMPQSETRIYSAQGSDIMADVTGVDAKGKPINTHFNATADGVEHPTGANSSTVVSIKQTGPGAYAGTIKRDGKVVGTNTAVISDGGKVFTFRSKGTDAEGKEFTSTMVYEKQ